MNTATPFPWTEQADSKTAGSGFRSIFEHAPLAAARCNPQGVIVEMNSAFERVLDPVLANKHALRLCDLVAPEERSATESLLRDLLASTCDSIRVAGSDAMKMSWTAWRLPHSGEAAHALVLGEPSGNAVLAEEGLLQSQRWEAVGRLAGGVVHDFNNLLTGVMLYCDLLLTSLDARDRRRRYADEIRSAIMQATGLVRQLLVFARPPAAQVRALCLNRIAQALQGLLTRLIGENIVLELNLDPDLGLVKIDQAQVQQILLNLILNARDALPNGGHIVVETRNCTFQSVLSSEPAKGSSMAFPCVLLAVSDNGCGMDAKTRDHLFEPFFTTKGAGKGTGLGLTTVRGIVTTSGGLIHLESAPGQGTRVMILLPRTSQPTIANFSSIAIPPSEASQTAFQEIKKESRL
jgi:signal transduction histidine kinase